MIRISPRCAPSSTVRALGGAIAADDIDELDVLIGRQGLFGNQQRLVGLAHRNAHAHEQAAGQLAIFIGKHAADAGRSGAGVDFARGKIELSFMREILSRRRAAGSRRCSASRRLPGAVSRVSARCRM